MACTPRRIAAVALAFVFAGASGTTGTAVAAGATNVGPGESIQAAVNAAAPGDTIRVTGRHRENVVVQTDGLTLIGHGAVVLPPAVPVPHACYDPTVVDEAVHGICVWGDVDIDTGEVTRYVKDVTVRGFRVRGFAGSGLVAVAAKGATFSGNTLLRNVDAGINVSNAVETLVRGNRSSGNQFGLLGSGAEGTRIVANAIRANCAGVGLLGAADTRIGLNRIARNSRACPAAAGDFPALSGIGVVVVSSTGTAVVANRIVHNRATSQSAFAGGVVVVQESSNSLVKRNVILRNDPDLSWDKTGSGNVFPHNICATSVPSGLCG
jgi:nitrous oxidase accessory protein NosD